MTLYIGTSGWQYAHWRGGFYPAGLHADEELEYYAGRFQVVEVNATFYRLPEAEVFERWAKRTPADFTFAIKASRFLTHVRRLREPEEPVRRLMERAARLGSKLGPVLLQLPPGMRCNVERLRATLTAFAPGVRVACEFRDDSWFAAEVYGLLTEHNAALSLADRGSQLITPARRTADWGYLRMHEGGGDRWPSYDEATLSVRLRLLRELWGDADTFVFFNNDAFGCAVRDAALLARIAREAGVQTSRVGAPDGAWLGR